MHETFGDSYGTSGSTRIYRDEVPGVTPPTQVRHQEMNSFQEEIANVIRAEGFSLNSHTESLAQMIQLNTAIDKKVSDEAALRTAADAALDSKIDNLDASDIDNDSGVAGSNVDDALDTLAGLIATEDSRNDTQDGQISALETNIGQYIPASAVKGDVLVYDTADSQWKPCSIRAFKSRQVIEALNTGFASNWNPNAEYEFTGIQCNLKGRYADPGDGGVPQGNTLFQTYTIPGGDIPEWHVDAVYRAGSWHIRGRVVFILPASISNGYGGYTTTIYQAMQIRFTGPGNLWYGPVSSTQYDGCGRTLAPFKRFASTSDDVNYAADQKGYFVCSPNGLITGNGIWLGDEDFWFDEFTRSNARTMPGIFTPSRKYAISFDVMAPSFTNVFPNPS